MSDQTQLDLNELKRFLMRANMPHATGTSQITSEEDGSRTITYAEGDFRMHDNFFGGEPYGGRLVISYQGAPVFLEVYYGRVYDTQLNADEVYDFLRTALQHPTDDNPFRGPAEFSAEGLRYVCTTEGDVSNHTVREYIYQGDAEIYSAVVIGGLVDRNARGAM